MRQWRVSLVNGACIFSVQGPWVRYSAGECVSIVIYEHRCYFSSKYINFESFHSMQCRNVTLQNLLFAQTLVGYHARLDLREIIVRAKIEAKAGLQFANPVREYCQGTDVGVWLHLDLQG